MRRRQQIRRLTIIATVAIIAVSLAIGIYLASTAGNSSIDSRIGQPVTTSDMNSLYRDALQPYGPSPPQSMLNEVVNASGPAFTAAGGRPIVVYVGAEFCPYCAVQRWSLIMALMRFGNFSNLSYMASSPGEGDLATFTFLGSSYSSRYLVFQPFENEDRNNAALQTVPSNYSAEWQTFGSKYPFMNFGNKYIVPSATMLFTDLSGKNWTRVLSEINSGDNFGTQVRQSANLITSLICKVTGDVPSSVCNASPIQATESGIRAPVQMGEAFVPTAARATARVP